MNPPPWLKNNNQVFFGFILIWFLLALLQSGYTTLLNDEAYYWVLSSKPALGYFDHPPFVAWMIKAGYAIFESELGVRLISVLMNVFTIIILREIIKPKNILLFLAIISSIVIIHTGSFLAVPDIPLVFFTVLFFYLILKFLEKNSWKIAAALGLVMALMMYSKYHGILVIIFTIIAYPKFIKSKKAWFAVLISLLAFSPHLYWLFQNDFLTVDYQLTGRKGGFEWMNILNYIGGQLLVFGPLVSFILFYTAFSHRTKNYFEKILKVNLFGFIIFFFFMCFKGTVEANWTASAAIPLIILSYHKLTSLKKLRKITYYLCIPSLLLILVFRVFIIYDFTNYDLKKKTNFHGWETWAEKIEAKAGDLPVIFFNTYQEAAKYSFYADGTGYSVNTYPYSGSQYDQWDFERKLRGKPAFIVFKYDEPMVDSLELFPGKHLFYEIDSTFYSYSNIDIELSFEDKIYEKGKTYTFEIKYINKFKKPVTIKGEKDFNILTAYCFFDEDDDYSGVHEEFKNQPAIQGLTIQKQYIDSISITMPEKKGEYKLHIGIKSGWMWPGNNSPAYDIRIE